MRSTRRRSVRVLIVVVAACWLVAVVGGVRILKTKTDDHDLNQRRATPAQNPPFPLSAAATVEGKNAEEAMTPSAVGNAATAATKETLEDRDRNLHRDPLRTLKSTPTKASNWVAPQSPDDHLVSGPLPVWHTDADAFPTSHWAGHLPASNGDDDKYLFYWLFAPDFGDAAANNDASSAEDDKVPLIIWLNGGPGCSSMDGLWLENGPFRLTLNNATKAYGVTSDPHSWHKVPAYALYIDQPVGTGLSFTMSGTYPRNDEEVNVDFFQFLQSFFHLHSDKFVQGNTVHRPLYFSGESHAGHYIPSMMNYILKQNDKLVKNRRDRMMATAKAAAEPISPLAIPLAGAAIGNGWVDPYYQYAAAEAAYGKGLIGRSQWHALDQKEAQCQAQLAKGDYTPGVCFSLLNNVVDNSQGSTLNYKVSTYDARRSEPRHSDRTFPPGHKVVETYLGGWDLDDNDPGTLDDSVATQVLKAIHATAAASANQRYLECTDPPYEALSHQDGLGVVADVVEILQHPTKPRLLFFNGIEDLICNHVGNEKFLEHLPWTGKDAWIQSPRFAWRAKDEVEGQVSGYMKEYDNLSFLKLLNAGHMVRTTSGNGAPCPQRGWGSKNTQRLTHTPCQLRNDENGQVPLDVPPVALEMMQIFVHKESFSMSRQGLTNAPQDSSCPVCTDCPICPAAPDCDNNDNNNNNNNGAQPDKCEPCDGNSSGSSTNPGPSANTEAVNKGLVGGLVALSFLLGGLLVCFVCRNSGGKRGVARSLVPQYDLELRQERQYMDEPNGLELS